MFKDLFNLNGKVALVSGGSKGLGKAMARGLAEMGADVMISSRHEEELRPAIDEIVRDTGRKGRFVVADMAKRTMDRLLYYQYLMAKAYQYRTLKRPLIKNAVETGAAAAGVPSQRTIMVCSAPKMEFGAGTHSGRITLGGTVATHGLW